jgi:hypothetical protein
VAKKKMPASFLANIQKKKAGAKSKAKAKRKKK